MNSKQTSFLVFVFVLASLSCNLIYGQPKKEQPPAVSEQRTSPTAEPGLSPTQPVSSSEPLVSDSYPIAITTGGTHACVLLSNGKVKCWGSNSEGQLGDGTYTTRSTPAEVPGLENVTAISAGGSHTCALLATGDVKCFGDNYYGQLGDGTMDKRWTPTPVIDLTDAVSISAGDEHTCAITKENKAKCWGKNLYFRIGSGTNDRIFKTPVEVIGLGGAPLALAPGYEHTCAVVEAGKVQCRGHNNYGQVGIEDIQKSLKSPIDVTGLGDGVTSVSTGYSTSCAVTAGNSVLCWGWIGMYDYFTSPQAIDEMRKDMAAVAAGGNHICGLTDNGIVKCLGENEHGQLGDGTTHAVYYGTKVKGLEDVQSIAAGMDYTCALTRDGRVFCWGQNSSGQLGNGSNTPSTIPVEVEGLRE